VREAARSIGVRIPERLELDPGAAYVHLTSNNTLEGTQWPSFPDTGLVPLVADMSSDIFSRPIDVARFALIYACAQKNLGPSGVTLVIASKEFLSRARADLPPSLRYDSYVKTQSLYNTPPTFSIHVARSPPSMPGIVTRRRSCTPSSTSSRSSSGARSSASLAR
jgi:phosphoserine aminotransferase